MACEVFSSAFKKQIATTIEREVRSASRAVFTKCCDYLDGGLPPQAAKLQESLVKTESEMESHFAFVIEEEMLAAVEVIVTEFTDHVEEKLAFLQFNMSERNKEIADLKRQLSDIQGDVSAERKTPYPAEAVATRTEKEEDEFLYAGPHSALDHLEDDFCKVIQESSGLVISRVEGGFCGPTTEPIEEKSVQPGTSYQGDYLQDVKSVYISKSSCSQAHVHSEIPDSTVPESNQKPEVTEFDCEHSRLVLDQTQILCRSPVSVCDPLLPTLDKEHSTSLSAHCVSEIPEEGFAVEEERQDTMLTDNQPQSVDLLEDLSDLDDYPEGGLEDQEDESLALEHQGQTDAHKHGRHSLSLPGEACAEDTPNRKKQREAAIENESEDKSCSVQEAESSLHCSPQPIVKLTRIDASQKVEANVVLYLCRICGRQFKNKIILQMHLLIHGKKRQYGCSDCEKKFVYKTSLEVHKRTHTGKHLNVCNECGMKFIKISHLQRHQKIHTGEKPFICDECGKHFRAKDNLVQHQRTHIVKVTKPYSCSECGKKFSRGDNLFLHQRIHTGDKPFVCALCDKRFLSSTHLYSHIRSHTGEKPYRCPECGKTFSGVSNLYRHQITHRDERAKRFTCGVCGKGFNRTDYLRRHERIHSGEKLFPCPECGKTFAQKSNLESHKRTHTGEKPFACPQCGRRFSQKTNLKTHYKVHTGERFKKYK
ncbi:zinc finger protein 852-like isoform X2 [Polypterus senegalus]|uniref:zinc finger protein 852-like isoform X2 n=1 Tax=Polypterus senegalus TaxID=55291 RepID=UPI0019642323|nr:zinc finger protein 852-like isoform X2 [Polypterus senegalus]